MQQIWTLRGSLGLSILVHAWVIHAAPRLTSLERPDPPPMMVEFSREEPAPLHVPEPTFAEEPAPEPEPEPTLALQEPPPLTEPEPEAASSEPEASVDEPASAPEELTGTTLTAEGEGAFSAEVGSGRARRGAIRAGGSKPALRREAPRPKPMEKPPEPKATEVIPLAQLSKRPAPPDLGPALERNFPLDARRQGKAGEAQVRARVEPSGAVQVAQVFFESASGFGDACKKTLLESKWTAPLNREGNPVATWVSYRCKFRVD